MERTLAMIKPGACNRGEAGDIFSHIESQGMRFRIVRARYFRMDLDTAHAFYKDHVGKDYYDGLIAHTVSGPCMAVELEADNVIKRWRDFIGPTKPQDGRPDQLRCRFGVGVPDNAVHGSDSPESAAREIALVFQDDRIALNPAFQVLLDKYMSVEKPLTEALVSCPTWCGPQKSTFGELVCKMPGEAKPFILGQPNLGDIVYRDPPPAPVAPTIKFRRIEGFLGSKAVLPIRAKKGDSGMDLVSAEDKLIRKGSTVKVTTGWKIELPEAIEAQVRPRSGMSAKGIFAAFGTVDASYRGEMFVTLFNSTGEDYWVHAGDKVAQMVPMPVYDFASCEVVGPLSETDRGESGYGSTGR